MYGQVQSMQRENGEAILGLSLRVNNAWKSQKQFA